MTGSVEELARRGEADWLWVARRLSEPEKRGLMAHFWWHAGQQAPEGEWRTWLMLAGRGFGKTRAGAEWVSELARTDGTLRIALVGATLAEVTRVMVLGETGLKAVARAEEDLLFYPSRGLVEFASGAQGFCFSGRNPEALRGAQHDFAWCDELAKWRYPEETWSNLMLGMRLREGARTMVTTTPRPIPLLRKLLAAADTAATRGRTPENDSLPDDFVDAMIALYGGTRLGRQELDGELIEDVERALSALGLRDENARRDMDELRELLRAWRDAKRSAREAVVAWAVRIFLAILVAGIAVKVGLLDYLR